MRFDPRKDRFGRKQSPYEDSTEEMPDSQEEPSRPKDRLDNYLLMDQINLFSENEVGKLEYLVGIMEHKVDKRSVMFSCLNIKETIPEELDDYIKLIEKMEHDWTKGKVAMVTTQTICSFSKEETLSFLERVHHYSDRINEVVRKYDDEGEKSRVTGKIMSRIRDSPDKLDEYFDSL